MNSLWFASDTLLIYMKYRYEHCDKDCESCPCKVEGYHCRYVYEETTKEIDKREKYQKKKIDKVSIP